MEQGSLSKQDPTRSRPKLRDLRAACRSLTPVIVDLGPRQPKLASYMLSVEGRGAGAFLRLGPIAAEHIPDGVAGVVVRTTDPDRSLAVAARRIRRVDPSTAEIALEGARMDWLGPRPRARTVVEARDPMMLLVSSGLEGADVHVFPIVDLAEGACAIEAGRPPHPGTRLEWVQIVRDGAVVRRGAAVVEEVIPWRASSGAPRFRCRLRFVEREASPRARTYGLVEHPPRVKNLMELAATAAVGVWARAGDRRVACGSLAVEGATMRLRLGQPLGPAPKLTVGFELFTIHYELDARVLEASGSDVTLALPLYLRRRTRRRERRVEVPSGREIQVELDNRVAEHAIRRRLLDLSFGGLCFEADPAADVLWPGLRLEEARLTEGGESIALGPVEVRAVEQRDGRVLCHCAVSDPERLDVSRLSVLASRLEHPELLVHDGRDFRAMLDLYRRSHLLYDYMARSLEPLAPAAAFNWRRLHREGHDLVRTLVHVVPERGMDAAVSAVRAWDQGWIIQHFGVADGADQFRWSGELQRAIVDHVMLRPDGRFLFFFVSSKNTSMNAFYERFFEATGTSEAIEHGTVDFWARPPGRPRSQPAPDDGTVLRNMRQNEAALVARAAERALGPRTAAALSILPGSIDLPATRRVFQRIGLERSRTARIVSRRRTPQLALLSERLSPGINLTWMLGSHWLLPIHAGSSNGGAAVDRALATIEHEPAPSPYGERFVLVPRGHWPEALERRGWELRVTARTYVMNRAGLQRYHDYVADRYGSAGARLARRRMKERVG